MKVIEWLTDKYWDLRHWAYFGTWPTPYQGCPEPPEPGVTVIEGIHLVGVHDPALCEGRPCVVHNPTDHHMRSWKLHWCNDRKIFERLCPCHGIGHPDPDQFQYWQESYQEWQTVHGCCGACRGPR